MTKRPSFSVTLALAALLLAPAAQAEIAGFSFLGFQSSIDLDDQLGDDAGDTEHLINIEDCQSYLGESFTASFEIAVNDTDTNSIAYGYSSSPGGSCSGTVSNLSTTECFVDENNATYDSGTQIDIIDIPFDSIMGSDCSAGTHVTSVIYIALLVSSSGAGTETDENETIEIEVDLEPPSPPTLDELVEGDQRFEVYWTDDSAEDGTTYNVYYSESSFSDPTASSVSSKKDVDALNTEIDDSSLVNGTTYYVRVSAVDKVGNEGDLSSELTVVPIETTDFWEAYVASGGTDPGGFCFIATAAYGTPMAAQLDTLRAFRDDVLMPTTLGAAFVDGYYRWGRFAAAMIADKPALRAATRVALVPLVGLAHVASLPVAEALAWLLVLLAGLLGARRLAVTLVWRGVPAEVRR